MKKIINAPETYVDDMLKGIYAAHGDQVKYAVGDLRCYCIANKKPGKVAIITGGGSGHLPLFLGYVGDGLIVILLHGGHKGTIFLVPAAQQANDHQRAGDRTAGGGHFHAAAEVSPQLNRLLPGQAALLGKGGGHGLGAVIVDIGILPQGFGIKSSSGRAI